MKDLFTDPFFLALEGFLFAFAISTFFLLNTIYIKTEENTLNAMREKNTLTQTYTMQDSEEALLLTGTTVFNEIISYADAGYAIKLNGTVLNNITTTDTGLPFFEHIKKYGAEDLLYRISNTLNYRKTCILNNTGDIVGIEYVSVY